ncbi:taste receptor type 2 member 41-like [Discoglossus pictus]
MFNPAILTIVTLGVLESIFGVICNLSLITLSCRDPTDDFRLSPSNQIHFSMGLTNVFLQCILTVAGFIYSFYPLTLASRGFSPGLIFLMYFFISLTCWLTAWLCSFYCVTIIRFKNSIMTSLKMGLSTLLPKMLMVTALGSFCLAVPSIWHAHAEVQQKKTGNSSTNFTANDVVEFGFSFGYGIVFTMAGCIVPLIISLSSIGLTVGSLLRHVWRIKLNASNSSSPQLEAHYRACRTMILLVILYVIFNLTEIITISFTISTDSVFTITIWFVTMMYPMAQSLIVISGSSKLKASFWRVVLQSK